MLNGVHIRDCTLHVEGAAFTNYASSLSETPVFMRSKLLKSLLIPHSTFTELEEPPQ